MFKKNQEVTVIGLWSDGSIDSKISKEISFRVEHLVVYSCGKKQMVLKNAAGEIFKGRYFQPQETQHGNTIVVNRVSDEDALKIADRMALEYCEARQAFYNNIISKCGMQYGEAYLNAIIRNRDHYATKPVKASFVA